MTIFERLFGVGASNFRVDSTIRFSKNLKIFVRDPLVARRFDFFENNPNIKKRNFKLKKMHAHSECAQQLSKYSYFINLV